MERLRPVTVARINTLMHLPPDGPLPPPPESISNSGGETAGGGRSGRRGRGAVVPTSRRWQDRVAGDEAAPGVSSHKEYCPGLRGDGGLRRLLAGARAEPRPRSGCGQRACSQAPAARGDRRGQARSASAGRSGAAVDQVSLQVQGAAPTNRWREGEEVVRLYTGRRSCPPPRQNVKAARAACSSRKIPFFSLIKAQRNVVGLRGPLYEAITGSFPQAGSYGRAVGRLHATGRNTDGDSESTSSTGAHSSDRLRSPHPAAIPIATG